MFQVGEPREKGFSLDAATTSFNKLMSSLAPKRNFWHTALVCVSSAAIPKQIETNFARRRRYRKHKTKIAKNKITPSASQLTSLKPLGAKCKGKFLRPATTYKRPFLRRKRCLINVDPTSRRDPEPGQGPTSGLRRKQRGANCCYAVT